MSAQRAAQLMEAGLWLRLSGDTEGARRLFEQALKLDPTNTRARQLLAGSTPRVEVGEHKKTTVAQQEVATKAVEKVDDSE